MTVYQKFTVTANYEPKGADVVDWPKSLGGKVMAAAEKKGWKAPANMRDITDAFYRGLVEQGWHWTPSKPCGSRETAAKILDGENFNCECFGVANAFHILLTTKSPYGFGLKTTEAVVHTYKGGEALIGADNGTPTSADVRREAQSGFYATHSRDGVHHLKANIFDPQTNQMANLYGWRDHKVVEVGGRYWDVCYNTSYTYLQQMAVGMVIGLNENRKKVQTLQEAQALIHEYKVLVKNWHQIAYFRTPSPGSAAAAASAAEVGPFAESLYGDEATEGSLKALVSWAAPITD